MSPAGFLAGLLLAAGALLALRVAVLLDAARADHPPPAAWSYWRLRLPRGESLPAAQAAAWFAGLSPLLTGPGSSLRVELRGEHEELQIRLAAPPALETALRGQLAAWLPGARLEAAAPAPEAPLTFVPLGLQRTALQPLRVPDTREPDPLLGFLGALTRAAHPAGFRITLGPAPEDWKAWAPAALEALRAGDAPPPHGWTLWLWEFARFLRRRTPPIEPGAAGKHGTGLAAAAAKARAPVLSARLCVWVSGSDAETAAQGEELARCLAAAADDPPGNRLILAGPHRSVASGSPPELAGPELPLTPPELGALFHLPPADHPLVPAESSRVTAPPPRLLPTGSGSDRPLTWLGEALTPEGPVPFGLGVEERRLHTYVVGKTGTGKSTLLATLARQDLEAGRGLALIDPHGDLAERVLSLVPPGREEDVLYFNPADREFPVPFNPLACRSPAERPQVASAVVGVFKKLYRDSWGPRLEHFLRNSVLTLLETPSPTLLLLPRLLTDRGYRRELLTCVQDPLLRSFFHEEYESYDPRWRAEAISPILNKVGQFLASPLVRHVVGPGGPGIDLRALMDAGGICIANLASGRIGEDNGALLGGLLVAAFQQAAMSRAGQPEAERRDFFLLVDEFQHFANDAFGIMLSEARKYRLCLTLSHQYLDQLPAEVLDAVCGNAGTLCVFRVGAGDTARLVRELAPRFDAQDLIHLPDHHFCVRPVAEGRIVPAFSARTVPLTAPERDPRRILDGSRRRYARPRAQVELEIADLWEGRTDGSRPGAGIPRPG